MVLPYDSIYIIFQMSQETNFAMASISTRTKSQKIYIKISWSIIIAQRIYNLSSHIKNNFKGQIPYKC